MHLASSAQPSTRPRSTAAPYATCTRVTRAPASTPRRANAKYTSVRFVKAQVRSGDVDHTIETPDHTARPSRPPRKSPAGRSRSGGERSRTAASTSAQPPIQTRCASEGPPPKKRAQKESAAAANAPQGRPTRSPAARTGGDASIGVEGSIPGSQTVYIGQTVRTPAVERLGRPPATDDCVRAHFR